MASVLPETVIIVNDFAFINGGQAKVAIDSARLLADSGIKVVFFAACGPVNDGLKHDNIRTICLDQRDILSDPNRTAAVLRGIWNHTAKKELSKLVKQFDPKKTVLHCHGYAKALSPSIGKILTDGPLPSIYTMHEYFLACPNGGFYDYKKNEICTKRALSKECLLTNCDVRHPLHKAWKVARQGITWYAGRIPQDLRDVIYISGTQLRAMKPYLHPDTNLHYVPNPITIPAISPVKAVENDIYLFIGRLNPEKGGLMFAEAAKQAGVKAVFVGDGPERKAIEKVNPDARITGWLPSEDVQKWIHKARCLVFPSLWYETFGLVAYDALALGIPTICGIWNAASEAVIHDKNGLIYNNPTLEELKQCLVALTEDKHTVFTNNEACNIPTGRKHLEILLNTYEHLMQVN